MAEETQKKSGADYGEQNIITLEWYEHIRRRSGMYIGRLGNGERQGDGIYVLLKEVIDNSVDEFSMGFGKRIDITIDEDKTVTVRDFGRGIPLGSVVDVTSKLNTGGKFDTEAFQKSVGMNGVGTKAVNALSSDFWVESFRDGQSSFAHYSLSPITPAASCSTAVSAKPPRKTAPSSASSPMSRCSKDTPSTWTSWRRW